MKTLRQIRMAAVGMVAVAAVQTMAQMAPLPAQAGPQAAAPTHTRVIVVSLEDRKLALVEDGQVKKVYTVAVGKPSTPSPVGTFTIERRVRNPTYSHDGRVVAAGPNNPVGTRWMGLSIRGYGIHGTNAPRSIGKAASHGCIRMARADLEALYAQVRVGDTVELIGQRDEQTAQLFGAGAAQPAADMQLAAATGATQPAAPAVHEAVAANVPAVAGAL
ncbi:MAG TPA: L,D-transpeptidase [Terracidiphilus sp.]|nr:L,D-transpeptidase [Terracidiphilus sp.]